MPRRRRIALAGCWIEPAGRQTNGSDLRQVDELRGLRASGVGIRPGRLVFGDEGDTALMAVVPTPRCRKERFDDPGRFVFGVHAGADRHHIGVIVLAAQARRFGAPREYGPYTLHLVRGNLLAVARPTYRHSRPPHPLGHSLTRADAERRIIVEFLILR